MPGSQHRKREVLKNKYGSFRSDDWKMQQRIDFAVLCRYES
jgi:hypothetical protein